MTPSNLQIIFTNSASRSFVITENIQISVKCMWQSLKYMKCQIRKLKTLISNVARHWVAQTQCYSVCCMTNQHETANICHLVDNWNIYYALCLQLQARNNLINGLFLFGFQMSICFSLNGNKVYGGHTPICLNRFPLG